MITFACQKDLPLDSKNNLPENGGGFVNDRGGKDGDGKGAMTVLGQQHSNPYAVDNIRQAYKSLYEINLPSLTANHLYVRFLPQDVQDIGELLNTGLAFTDYPLDYDIVSMGDYYQDPGVTNPDYTPRYAVVEYNFVFPNVPYEVLEQLALVPEDSRIAEKAFQLKGLEYETPDVYAPNPSLVNNRFDFKPDHNGGVIQATTPGQPCGCPLPDNVRKPSGCVTVFDNVLPDNHWDPVREVKVLVSRTQFFGWAFHRTAVTSGKGCWEIDHKYKKKINIWVKYESPTCNVKVMETAVGIWGYTWPYQPYIGQYGGPNFNNIGIAFNWTNSIDSKTFRNWAAATANNSVFEFQNYSAANGLPNPPGNLKILITPWGDENKGAAPMLEKLGISSGTWNTSVHSVLLGVFGVFGALPPYLVAFPLGALVTVAAPDIVMNINDNTEVNADDFRELFYHELAHAQHSIMVGSIYWNENIEYVAMNGGYGNGNAPGAGKCSVIESWGWHNGRIAVHNRYGGTNSNVGTPATNTWRAVLEENYAWSLSSTGLAHIPWGWQWDVQDNNATNLPDEKESTLVNPSTTINNDAVFGITEAQIFSTMTSSMQSIPQMKVALIPFLPGTVSTAQFDNDRRNW